MTTGNRPTRASCALAVLVAGTLALAASCGGSGPHAPGGEPASLLVARTLGGEAAVRSGRVALSLSLQAPGARRAFTLHSAARFRIGAVNMAPSLALTLVTVSHDGSGPARALRATLVSSAGGISLSLQGRRMPAGPQAQRALQAGYGRLATVPGGGHGATAPLGLDASAWLADPRFASAAPGLARDRVHVRAGLALAPFLADVGRLVSLSSGLEQATGRAGSSAPALALWHAARTESGAGTVDLYADPGGQLPRSLTASVGLHGGPGTAGRSAAPVSVSLRMRFSGLGRPAAGGGAS
ncbi:MAG TPA: hypothetical protein VLZ06_00480 [Solirubrobacteraceae bacterium]|nr:hypothetical protein [Solirubrobacteraceae bacterium]